MSRRISDIRNREIRQGKTLVLVLITLPAIFGLIGLIIDGGFLFARARHVQDVADSAATAAATEKKNGKSNDAALSLATQVVRDQNHWTDAEVILHSPPITGPYAGSSSHVELIVNAQVPTCVIQLFGGPSAKQVSARAVAGFESSTAGAAITILDEFPSELNTGPLPALPVSLSAPAITGGLEVEGLGVVRVDGAVLVNTKWGGQDENGDQVGEPAGIADMSHGVSAMPLTGLTRLRARDIRVVGGVDDRRNYENYTSGKSSPLRAGMLPVPDPLEQMPAPTLSADPINVRANVLGAKTVVGLPIIGPPIILQPGVYEWIEVISGTVTFQPGVYVIRGKNPLTQLSLSIIGGNVKAEGVMFYITDSATYSPVSGTPDADDVNNIEPPELLGTLTPSVLINIGLLGSSFSGLDAAYSPFHQTLIYQRRNDRRPILLVQENIIGPGQLRGTVYAKSSHVILAGKGTYDARFVVGTMRIVALLDVLIQPSERLPSAQDVYLVE